MDVKSGGVGKSPTIASGVTHGTDLDQVGPCSAVCRKPRGSLCGIDILSVSCMNV